ncbi:UbiA family prenyltransferase [Streptomyces sp. LN245]|uniref:UbiA family prenyltransferase n=1 Tax=Streptomyces sp. LN245 TaxID=3112975 RepID=UPI00371B9F2B
MGTPEHTTAGDTAGRGSGLVAGLGRACHPGPVVAVTTLTAALAVITGRGPGACFLVWAAVLAGQLSVGWCNDAFDARRDIAAYAAVASPSWTARSERGRRGLPRTRRWPCAYPSRSSAASRPSAVHLTAVGAAWAYNLRLKATCWSWAPYALGFAALPAFVTLGLPGRPWPAWWVLAAGALLGVGAHLGDVLPDIRGDLVTGVRGWPQRLGPDRARLLLPVPLVIASALLALGPAGPPGRREVTALALVLLVAVTGTVLGRRRERLAFATAVVVAAVDVSLLLGGTGMGPG